MSFDPEKEKQFKETLLETLTQLLETQIPKELESLMEHVVKMKAELAKDLAATEPTVKFEEFYNRLSGILSILRSKAPQHALVLALNLIVSKKEFKAYCLETPSAAILKDYVKNLEALVGMAIPVKGIQSAQAQLRELLSQFSKDGYFDLKTFMDRVAAARAAAMTEAHRNECKKFLDALTALPVTCLKSLGDRLDRVSKEHDRLQLQYQALMGHFNELSTKLVNILGMAQQGGGVSASQLIEQVSVEIKAKKEEVDAVQKEIESARAERARLEALEQETRRRLEEEERDKAEKLRLAEEEKARLQKQVLAKKEKLNRERAAKMELESKNQELQRQVEELSELNEELSEQVSTRNESIHGTSQRRAGHAQRFMAVKKQEDTREAELKALKPFGTEIRMECLSQLSEYCQLLTGKGHQLALEKFMLQLLLGNHEQTTLAYLKENKYWIGYENGSLKDSKFSFMCQGFELLKPILAKTEAALDSEVSRAQLLKMVGEFIQRRTGLFKKMDAKTFSECIQGSQGKSVLNEVSNISYQGSASQGM